MGSAAGIETGSLCNETRIHFIMMQTARVHIQAAFFAPRSLGSWMPLAATDEAQNTRARSIAIVRIDPPCRRAHSEGPGSGLCSW